jgi:hypothetical protein
MSAFALRIEHATTSDMPDGQALPPYIEDGVIWHVIDRYPENNTTRWRRISLIRASASPPSPRGPSLGGTTKDN